MNAVAPPSRGGGAEEPLSGETVGGLGRRSEEGSGQSRGGGGEESRPRSPEERRGRRRGCGYIHDYLLTTITHS